MPASPSVRWCRVSPATIRLLSRIGEKIMADTAENPLISLSEAMAERARLARFLVAGIAVPGHQMRSGTLWRKDVVVASEQRFPDTGEAQVTMADGGAFTARVAGRDSGTNVVALTLDGSPDPAPLPAGEPQPGGLALAPGAHDARISLRLGRPRPGSCASCGGVVRACWGGGRGLLGGAAPSWHSRGGGRIDRRITLDIG